MRIKNLRIRNLLTKTDKTAVPFSYIERNQSNFSIKPQTWEFCHFCSVKRQKRFFYYYNNSQILCRECTETALITPILRTQTTVLNETTRSVIQNNFNWIQGQMVNQEANHRLNQVIDLFDIGLNIVPALSILLEDKLPRGAKELLEGCVMPMLRIFQRNDPTPNKLETLIFTKEEG